MPATQVLVIGEQGTGKTSAWETMDPATTVIISPNAKPFPWAGSAKQYVIGKNRIQTKKLNDIPGVLDVINRDLKHVTTVLIEDITHFFTARTTSPEFMARKTGNDAFARWNEFAADVANIINIGETYRDDLVIVWNGHTEMNDSGLIAMLTPGKLLDKDIKPPSFFTYVLHSLVIAGDSKMDYKFLTNKNGTHDAKSPKGCFKELLIPNDMKVVIETIRKYQNG